MRRIGTALLIACATAGLLGGTPLIMLDSPNRSETSNTFASLWDGMLHEYDDYDDWENSYSVWYIFVAEGSPWMVDAETWREVDYGEERYSLDGSVSAEVVGEAMIIGGNGTAYVEFLLRMGGGNACASFSPLGIMQSVCGANPLARTLFRFNEPFAYRLFARADSPDESSHAQLLGIRVTDQGGHVLAGAELVPGDHVIPPDPVPEPASLSLAAAGAALIAWRLRPRPRN